MGSQDEPLIDGLAAGTIFSFAWNFLISISFQFVGFMVTYLLHTSHASKYGSRAGLGVTLIQYGLYSREGDMEDVVVDDSMGMMGGDGGLGMPTDVSRRSIGMLLPRLPKRGFEVRSWTTMVSSTNGDSTTTMQSEFSMSSTHDWISFLLMTLGIFSSFAYLSSQLIAIFKVGSSSSRLSSASYARNGGRIPLGNLPIPPRPRQRRRSLRNCKLENTCAPCSG